MKIQLKRSNVTESDKAKAPTAAQMEYGEIAVNYNTADPALFIKDSANAIIRMGDYADEIAAIEENIDQIEADILQIKADIDAIEANVVAIKADISTIYASISNIDIEISNLKSRVSTVEITANNNTANISTLQGEVITINEDISDINTLIEVLPDPLKGVAYQSDTLDDRYISRFSWSDLPSL